MTARQSAATERALKLVAQGKMTPYAAAKKTGIALSTMYRALRRIKEKEQATNSPHLDYAEQCFGNMSITPAYASNWEACMWLHLLRLAEGGEIS